MHMPMIKTIHDIETVAQLNSIPIERLQTMFNGWLLASGVDCPLCGGLGTTVGRRPSARLVCRICHGWGHIHSDITFLEFYSKLWSDIKKREAEQLKVSAYNAAIQIGNRCVADEIFYPRAPRPVCSRCGHTHVGKTYCLWGEICDCLNYPPRAPRVAARPLCRWWHGLPCDCGSPMHIETETRA
jgi:hypothetical protein